MKFLSLSILLCVSSVYGANVHLESLKSIADKVNSLRTTWKANSDLPSHLTTSSFKGLLGALESERKLPVRSHKFTDIEIPEEFDAREQWPNCPTIRHIRDQGNCGSCWAVATAGAFTDRACIASNGTFTLPLSDEQMLACCEECGYGCKGGYPEDAWNYLSTNGLVTGGGYNSGVGCQPYSIESCEHHTDGDLPPCSSLPDGETPVCKHKCTNEKYGIPFAKDHHRIVAQTAYTLNNDVSEIQKDILLHGPVEATFAVYSDFVTYKSGVYQHVSGTRLGGHAVRLIGWGVDEEDETPYWLLANSWNHHWGEQGVFKIIRGQNECGIEEGITAGIPIV